MAHTTINPDGSFDFSYGVNSSKVTTIQSELTPNGLKRSELAWLQNGTVRGGGITQRTGWVDRGIFHTGGLYQGGILYEALDSSVYAVVQIDGEVWRFDVDNPAGAINLSAVFGLTNNAASLKAYFCQAEQFLIIQSGDNVTLPLFWDGTTLRRSAGLAGVVAEIPEATAMDYYMGRLWYAQGRTYGAGDIVRGPSGTPGLPYNLTDSVLKVTENPLCLGGDNFTVPTSAGNIRAIKHSANINTQLGEGSLYIFTRKQIYSLTVPVTRTDWIGADVNNMPIQTVAQINNGAVSDWSIVAVNGDLFYTSLDPAYRSLTVAVRNFQQWGNKPISANVDRALQFNDRSKMFTASGMEFSNRLLMTILPGTAPDGINIISQGIAVLDFDPISSLEIATAETQITPSWEGMWDGLNILQLLAGDFGGLDRAFATTVSEIDNSLHMWELTTSERFENGDNRVSWYIESPAYTWGNELELKRLVGGEIWIDKVFGTVQMTFKYRGDADPCWHPWFATTICSEKNCTEDVNNPCAYPTTWREGYRFPVTLPEPSSPCDSMGIRPAQIAHQFQLRIELRGWCRIRGMMLYSTPFDKAIYDGLSC
jgi:hypothetical protein